MKIRPALALLLSLPVLSPPVFSADEPVGAPTPTVSAAAPSAGADSEKKTDLELRMDRMVKAFRKLKKQVADPAQNAASLQLVATMDAAAGEAVEFTPEKAEDLPADQRAKFEDDFKAGIKDMRALFSKLSDALTAGKNDDAVKIVADIDAFEKKEHKAFRKPKKD